MKYIKRDLEQEFLNCSKEYACLLVIGPRQVGKTTMLEHLMDSSRKQVTLDDLDERRLAQTEPATFLQIHKPPLLIDEVQYAPELFSYIKMAVDKGAPPGSFWLTGSQAFKLMKLAEESLAGRTAVFSMSSVSQHELYGKGREKPFELQLDSLLERSQLREPADMEKIYERIWSGGMPGYVSGKYTNRNVFYSSYIATYIDRDVRNEIPGVDPIVFQDFIRAAACRAGQMLNYESIAGDVGISPDTAKRWLNVLVKSQVVYLLRPYYNNLLKRTVKTPKLYFFDTGLVAYLTKYTTPEILANGAMNGAILENYVVNEIRKSYMNTTEECLLWYYRDKDNKEIDLILENNGMLHPMEIKRSANPGSERIKPFKTLDKGSVPRGNGGVICFKESLSAVNSENYILPVWTL